MPRRSSGPRGRLPLVFGLFGTLTLSSSALVGCAVDSSAADSADRTDQGARTNGADGGAAASGPGAATDPPFSHEVADIPDDVEEGVALNPSTLIVSDGDMDNAVFVDSTIVFLKPSDEVKNLAVGAIITGINPKDDSVFLRSVSGRTVAPTGAIYIDTKEAPLTQAAPSFKTTKRLNLPDINYSLKNGDIGGFKDITAHCESCKVSFAPDLEFTLALRRASLQRLTMTLAGPLDANLKIDIKTPTAARSIHQEKELVRTSKSFVQFVGPVPLMEKVDIALVATVDGSFASEGTISLDLETQRQVELTLGRMDGKWTAEGDVGGPLAFESPVLKTVQSGDVTVSIKARADVSVFSVASAFLEAEAKANATWRACPAPATWSGNGNISLRGGAALKIPELVNSSTEKQLVNVEKKLGGTLPLPEAIRCD